MARHAGAVQGMEGGGDGAFSRDCRRANVMAIYHLDSIRALTVKHGCHHGPHHGPPFLPWKWLEGARVAAAFWSVSFLLKVSKKNGKRLLSSHAPTCFTYQCGFSFLIYYNSILLLFLKIYFNTECIEKKRHQVAIQTPFIIQKIGKIDWLFTNSCS